MFTRRIHLTCLLVALLLLLCDARWATASGYTAYKPIADGESFEITNVGDSEIWLAGSPQVVTANQVTDRDCNLSTGQWEYDSITTYWTGTSGMFKNGNSVGLTVTYICTNAAGTNTITAFANDNHAGAGNSALFDEDPVDTSKTVAVIVPVLDAITYGGSNYSISDVPTPQYSRAAGRDGAAAWKYNLEYGTGVTAATTFWHSSSLTRASSVNVFGLVSGSIPWVVESGTFGTTWPSGTFTHYRQGGSPPKITWTAASVTWRYKCPDGSNEYISMTSHSPNYYYVRSAPLLTLQRTSVRLVTS
jgi:hypothetical protein